MNSPAVPPLAPSTQPALELIALAQLEPEEARKRLRAILLTNPNHFGRVPAASFNSVLKIQEDTTYECISRVGYEHLCEQLYATIEIRQTLGYSSDTLIHGSEEFVRFYLSYDGGSKWLDQGVRSVNVCDAVSNAAERSVNLQIALDEDVEGVKSPVRVRAILSWNSPPPAGAPNWTPVWGNVVESDIEVEGSQFHVPGELHLSAKSGFPNLSLPGMGRTTKTDDGAVIGREHLQSPTPRSAETDPQHRVSIVPARAYGIFTSSSRRAGLNGIDLLDRGEEATGFSLTGSAEAELSARV